MKKCTLIFILIILTKYGVSQYGFGTNQPDQRSIVHIVSQDSTKGFIIPIVKTGAIAADPSIKGMLIYNVNDSCVKMCTGSDWHCLIGDNSVGITDDQNIDSLRLNGKILTAYLENGGSASINIQPIIDSAYVDISNNLLNDNTWLSELKDSINTDNQNLSVGSGTASTSIIDVENGDSIVLREGSNIQLTESGSQITISATGDGTGTDDQNVDSLRLTGTTLTTYIENGGNASVDLQPIVDSAVANAVNTDNQTIDVLSLTGTTLNISLEDDGVATQTVNLSSLQDGTGTDDQNISGSGLSGTNLTIGIEGGASEVVNLQPIVDSALANTPIGSDDQNLTVEAGTASTSIINIENGDSVIFQEGSNIQLTESGNIITISAPAAGSGTDDQNLNVKAGTGTTSVIDIEDGDSVIISTGTGLSISETGNTITLTNTVTDTDDQDLIVQAGTASNSIINITNGDSVVLTEGSNIQLTESGNSITISATGDGTGTDDQNISGSGLSGTNLTIGIENGTNQVVDLSPIGGDITAVTAGTGLTGGGTTGAITINAVGDNGLTTNADDIDLGGALNQNTIITQGAFSMIYNLDGAGDFLVRDAGTNVFAIQDNGQNRFGGNTQWRSGSTTGTILGQFVDDAGNGRLVVYEGGAISIDLDANSTSVFNQQGLNRDFRVESLDSNGMLFVDASANRVGVGTETPSAMLDVEGKTQTTTFQMTSGATNNYVLTSDASGNGTWQDVSGLFTDSDNQDLVVQAGTASNSIINITNGDSVVLVEGSNIQLTESGNSITISATGDGTGTDDQNISGSGLSGTNLTIGIENGTNQVVDLSPIGGDITAVTAGTGLTGGGTTGAVTINAVGDNGLTTNANDIDLGGALNQATTLTGMAATGGEVDVFTIDDPDVGGSGQDHSSSFKVIKSGTINAGALGQSIAELTYTGGAGSPNTYYIVGRKADEGTVEWGVDLDDDDYWSTGGITLGVAGAATGDYSGGNFRVESNGRTGIGTASPSASYMLDVVGTAHADAINVNGNYTLPTVDGTNGQVIRTNGSGTLSWTTPTNGDITGVTAGAGLTGGGTTGAVSVTAAANNGLNVDAGADRIQLGGALTENTTITEGGFTMVHNLTGAGDFAVRDNGAASFFVRDNGNVGFGTESPSYQIHAVESAGGDVSEYASYIDFNGSAAGALTANRTHIGMYVDYDASNIVGGTANGTRHYAYGTYSNLQANGTTRGYDWRAGYNAAVHNSSGDITALQGAFNYANASSASTGAIGSMYGANNYTYLHPSSTGAISNAFGSQNYIYDNRASAVSNARASYNYINNNGGGTITSAYGSQNYLINNSTGTLTNAYGSYSHINQDDAGGTITNSFTYYARQDQDAGTSTNAYLYYGTVEGTHANRWGLYLNNESRNYLSGNLGLGVTNPTQKLHVVGGTRITGLGGSGTRMVVTDNNGVLSTQAIPANGDITGVTAGTGLTGGGASGTVTINAVGDNGLTTNANDIDLGGALNQATTITQGANNMTFNLNSTGNFNIQDNGANRFRVLNNGRVEMEGTTDASGTANTGVLEIANALRFDANEIITNTNAALLINHDNNGDVRFDNTTLMVDASANRVGVGNTTPAYPLHVTGDGYFEGWVRNTGNRGWYNQTHGGGMYMIDATWIRTYGNKSFYHNTGTMRTDGNFQVGNGGQYASLPSGTTATVFNEGSFDKDFRIESNGNANMFFVNAGTNRVGIGTTAPAQALHVNGRIRSNGINETSDRRYKKEIKDLPEDILEKVLQLRGVTYTWKQNEYPKMEFEDGTQIGVIAQEIEEVFPEVVRTDANGYKSVDYSHLVPVLIEALKRENAKVDGQSKKIKQLEQDNQELKNRISTIEKALGINK